MVTINITENPEQITINVVADGETVNISAQEVQESVVVNVTDTETVNINVDESDETVTINVNESGGHEIQDEGDALPARPRLNFIGAGVTVTDNPGNGTTDVTIPGDGGGAASITEITYADMATALQNATLTPGRFYNITDANGTELGFICQAVKSDEITVNGTGGYLNADFQAVGDYSNVEAGTGVAVGTQLGIWRPGFEAIVIPYTNLSGGSFAVGDTITGQTTGATAVVDSDNGSQVTAYMTSTGVAFDGSEMLDNGDGVTADMDGAAGTPDIVLGDVVIWSLLHYQLTDDTLLDGTDPETNTDAYTLLDKATYPETYVEAWDVSEFDFPNNWLQYRADERGNKVGYSFLIDDDVFGVGYSAITDFQFGRNGWIGNIVTDGLVSMKNSLSEFVFNELHSGSRVTNVDGKDNSQIGFSILFQNSGITNIVAGANSQFSYNTLYAGAIIDGITFLDDCSSQNNIIENSGSLTGITAGANCSISRNKIGQGAILGGGVTMEDGAYMSDNEIAANSGMGENCTLLAGAFFSLNKVGINSFIKNCTLHAGASIGSDLLYSTIDGCTIGENGYIYIIGKGCYMNNVVLGENSAIDTVEAGSQTAISDCTFGNDSGLRYLVLAQNSFFTNKTVADGVYVENKAIHGNIDESETITESIEGTQARPGFSDITGTIDITGLTTLDINAAWAQYRGIINLTSDNATESIDTITNPPILFPFKLRPQGFALTITGTAYAGIGAGQIALKATDYVLDGDKGEYIVLEIDPLGSGCVVEKYIVNGLI